MVARDREMNGPDKEMTIEDQHAAAHRDDACRCKEVSEKTPRELLELMFSDLAFWKKIKKE
jgi:hypothetical protein